MGVSIRRLLTLTGSVIGLTAIAWPSSAWPSSALAAPAMPRSVWLLYSSQAPEASLTQPLIAPLEAVIEHLGMIPRRWDLARGVPGATSSVSSGGVVSLVPVSVGLPGYGAWLKDRMAHGTPLVAISPAAADPSDPAPIARVEDLAYVNPFSHEVRWRRDPYQWLDQGLHLGGVPRLDPTTVDGRRVFYAVVDVTGFTSPAVRPGRPLAAEVLRNEVFSRTPLPLSVAVCARDLKGHPRMEAIARSIFGLPNVEAACAPFNRPSELGPSATYTPGDRRRESAPSLHVFQSLLPVGRKLGLLLLPAGATPSVRTMQHLAALDVPAVAAGDPVWPHGATWSTPAPFTRSVDDVLLVSAGGADGAVLTHGWRGPLDGQLKAVELYRESEIPRRVAPVAVATSFKAGEHVASTEALLGLLRWAEREPLAPISASDEARMIAGFLDASVTPDGSGAWTIAHAGACRTVRFDDEPRDPDLEVSRGVAGFVREGHALYIHLAADSGRIVLSTKPPQRPHLETANAPLSAWTQGSTSLGATFDAKVPLRATFAGFAPQQVVRVKEKGVERGSRADDRGRLSLVLPSGHPAIEVIW